MPTFRVWECAAASNVTLYAGELRPLLLIQQAKCLNTLFHHLLHMNCRHAIIIIIANILRSTRWAVTYVQGVD